MVLTRNKILDSATALTFPRACESELGKEDGVEVEEVNDADDDGVRWKMGMVVMVREGEEMQHCNILVQIRRMNHMSMR